MVRIKTYNFVDVGCILFKNAEAITLPVSLSTICHIHISTKTVLSPNGCTSHRDDITRPPSAIDVLVMVRRVPLSRALQQMRQACT